MIIAGHLHKARLEGIDAPERGQPFSREAGARLTQLVLREPVRMTVHGSDRYGRLLARIYVGKIDVNLTLVREGLAWHFKKYSDDSALAVAEEEARIARRGVWSQESPVPPWQRRARPARHPGL